MNVKKYYKYLIITICICCICFTFIFFLSYPLKYKSDIKQNATTNLSPQLIASIIKSESSFNKNAKSSKGAIGIMQIMPSTANWVCLKGQIEYNEELLYNPSFNIKIGCLYLSYLINKFGVVDTAVVAYNAGEGVVGGWLKTKEYSNDGKSLDVIPYKESRLYLKKVKTNLKIYNLKFLLG